MKIKLRYVKSYKDRHGTLRTYYRRHGISQRIDGEPLSADWHQCYARIHKSFDVPLSKSKDHDTLAYAIEEYLRSASYLNLAPNSRANYRSALDELSEKLGSHKLNDFTRGTVVKIRDSVAKRSMSRASLTVKVLRLVFDTVADLDLIPTNPAKNVKPPPGFKSTPHRKWTNEEIQLFKDNAKPHVRRAMMVLLHTGLRCSDALDLTRSIIKDGMIEIKTGKTGAEVSIPIHPDMAAELANSMDIESIHLIAGSRGQKLGRHGLLAMFRREFKRLGAVDQPTTHGLRKNAVVSLLEVGASELMINSITGQSIPMIRHYGQEFDRRKMSGQVVKLWSEKK